MRCENIDPIFTLTEKSKNRILRHLLSKLKVDGDKVVCMADSDLAKGLEFPHNQNLLKLVRKHGK